jgi:hypothetical protein
MARIEGIDLDTGQFSMTLATEGEASDGNIISIKGGQIPERMPMLTSHWNDPTAALGSITNPEKLLKDSPPRLRAMGHIEMGGEGASAEIGRDLAHMIDKGHVTGVSIRWDDVPGKSVRRVNLPSDHPYYVDAEKANGPERWGLFFEEWRALEGSVVALGADPQALIGRADETDGEVASFWRAMASDIVEAEPGEEPPFGDDGPLQPPDESPEAKIAASLAALRIDAADCREAGASHADCINAIVDGTDTHIEAVDLDDCVIFLPAPVAEQLRARLETEVVEDLEAPEPDPEPDHEARADQPSPLALDVDEVTNPIDVEAFTEAFTVALDAADERYRQFAKDLVKLAQGKV